MQRTRNPSPAATRVATALLLVVVTVLAAGCGGGDAGGSDSGGSDAAVVDLSAVGDVDAGEQVYASTCIACHGAAGTGTPAGPPLVHEVYVPSHHADISFLLAVRNGVQPHHWEFGPMPPLPGVTDEQVADVVAYVRSLQRDAGLID